MFKRILASFSLLLLLAANHSVQAQDEGAATVAAVSNMSVMEDSLIVLADSVFNAPIPDTRIYYSAQFVKMLVRTLKVPSSFNYPFDKLGKSINIIYPDDKSFRIFNWVTAAPTESSRRYYAAIQLPGENLKLYGLTDYTEMIAKGTEDSILTNGKWFGALYYRIISKNVDGQIVHTLFGVNESGFISKRKVLDPLIITDKGPVFGAPVFGLNNQKTNKPINRFVLEYKKDVQAALNWDEERKAIYFDRLVSEQNDPNRKYTYVPTGQYDGFRWQGDKWVMVRDLIPIMELQDGQAPTGVPIAPEVKE